MIKYKPFATVLVSQPPWDTDPKDKEVYTYSKWLKLIKSLDHVDETAKVNYTNEHEIEFYYAAVARVNTTLIASPVLEIQSLKKLPGYCSDPTTVYHSEDNPQIPVWCMTQGRI